MSGREAAGHAVLAPCSVAIAQDPDDGPQLFQGLTGGRADEPRGFAHLIGPRVAPDLEPADVQRYQRHPVREHVVHLPGDPGPFRLPRLVRQQVLCGLRLLGPFAQRINKLTAGAQVHPPGHHRGQLGEGHEPHGPERVGADAQQVVADDRDLVQAGHDERDTRRPAEADVVHRKRLATPAERDRMSGGIVASATPVGQRRRNHSVAHATAPMAASTAKPTLGILAPTRHHAAQYRVVLRRNLPEHPDGAGSGETPAP